MSAAGAWSVTIPIKHNNCSVILPNDIRTVRIAHRAGHMWLLVHGVRCKRVAFSIVADGLVRCAVSEHHITSVQLNYFGICIWELGFPTWCNPMLLDSCTLTDGGAVILVAIFIKRLRIYY